ncbi:UDP-glucose 4-epimerase GalE [Halarsenatibacter silvermanii]|uniref:UDP-glucose 4-epimerase n=1 Tax=Halarsenatibacter silvermanii TaxID=321763 RepID=A0A1G9GU68_9FIRM|nr:UDP-glucose 4-epimerase GalE [Halarsenatibacter silvermanii]SDL04221.1 UDP-glucose 4-epimerase [Halarsenatibacter silvermanii]
MEVLVTGGAGYIGSHVVRELMKTPYDIVVIDNLQKGHREAVLAGEFYRCDLADRQKLDEIFSDHDIGAVIHLAADSLVGESMENPQKYYQNNLTAGLNLLEIMLEHNVMKMVFSSTAAVYGSPDNIPIEESDTAKPASPYGRSKLFYEEILADFDNAYGLGFVSLRYFNACGADYEAGIGEDHDPETHLIPLVLKTALRQRDKLKIFGTDYKTRDGTCIRDYIHVSDLARAHILALEKLEEEGESSIYNLGSGDGFSVKEVIEAAREVTGREIEAEPAERRPGDPPVLIASSEKIRKELGWEREYKDLKNIIETAWRWHSSNPEGYGESKTGKEI